MDMNELPSLVVSPTINLGFSARLLNLDLIFSTRRVECPLEFHNCGIAKQVDRDITRHQVPFREHVPHGFSVKVLRDRFPSRLMASWVNERDSIRCQPDLACERKIGVVDRLDILLDERSDGGHVALLRLFGSRGRFGRRLARKRKDDREREPNRPYPITKSFAGKLPERHSAFERNTSRNSLRTPFYPIQGEPEGRWRLNIQRLSEAEILDLARVRLEKNPLRDPRERRAFVQAVQSTGLLQHWRQGNKQDPRTNVGKKKLKERARLLDDALAGSGSDGSR